MILFMWTCVLQTGRWLQCWLLAGPQGALIYPTILQGKTHKLSCDICVCSCSRPMNYNSFHSLSPSLNRKTDKDPARVSVLLSTLLLCGLCVCVPVQCLMRS